MTLMDTARKKEQKQKMRQSKNTFGEFAWAVCRESGTHGSEGAGLYKLETRA